MLGDPDSYIWRAVGKDDLDALEALNAACQQADGAVSVATPTFGDLLDMPDTQMLCAEAPQDQATHNGAINPIAAVGWMRLDGTQAQLRGKVHPLHRRKGLGAYLLRWLEERARQLQPITLIIRNEAFNAGSAALYEQQGYTRDFLEIWMERNLSQALPPMNDEFDHTHWMAANTQQFFDVYYEAFKERPGFRSIAAEEWIADYADDPDFRPDLSLLALAGGEPVGFVTSGTNSIPGRTMPVGWISQIGVRPAWRGKGVAAGLIGAVMRAFQDEGLTALGLHVNVNNPSAIHVYEQLGFITIGQRVKYSKMVE